MNLPSLFRRKKIRVKLVRKWVISGTIDGHDPIFARWRINGPEGTFFLTVVCVNWGRGYSLPQFKRNVMRLLERVDGHEYVVLLMQEIDEADPAREHAIIKSMMEPGTTLVEWATREPIAVSAGVKVTRERKRMTMDQGSRIGAPDGTGPRRFFTSCLATIEGVVIGFGNQHPHRNMQNGKVQAARRHGIEVTKEEVADMLPLCDLMIHGGDMNTTKYPKTTRREKVAITRRLDTIRFIITNRKK